MSDAVDEGATLPEEATRWGAALCSRSAGDAWHAPCAECRPIAQALVEAARRARGACVRVTDEGMAAAEGEAARHEPAADGIKTQLFRAAATALRSAHVALSDLSDATLMERQDADRLM